MKKYGYLIEILGFLGILTLINFVWISDNIGFAGMELHPFWIVVLAITIKYELRQALAAATISGIFYLFLLFYFHNIHPANLIEFKYFQPVMLFLIFAIFGGQVRSSQNQKTVRLEESKNELLDKYATLKKRCYDISKIKDELSERIIGQTSTVSTVYKLAKKLNVLESEQLLPTALDFIVEVVGADKCSFYRWKETQLKLEVTSGWHPDDEKRYQGNIHNEIVRQALTNLRVVALTETFEQNIEDAPEKIEADVVMSAPITVGAQKSIYGVVNIEEIPFLKFNPDSIKLFSLIADWISHTVTLALEIQRTGGTADKSEQFEQYFADNFNGAFKFGTPLSEMKA